MDDIYTSVCVECIKYKFPQDPTCGRAKKYSELLAGWLCYDCYQIIEMDERQNTIDKLAEIAHKEKK